MLSSILALIWILSVWTGIFFFDCAFELQLNCFSIKEKENEEEEKGGRFHLLAIFFFVTII